MHEKRWNQFSKADFESQPFHHFLTDLNRVYIFERVFTYGLGICKLIADRAILGYRILK